MQVHLYCQGNKWMVTERQKETIAYYGS